MIMHFIKTDKGAIPQGEESVKAWNKIKGEFSVEWKPKRNLKFHKKFFKLLDAVYTNLPHHTDNFENRERFRKYVLFKTGYYNTYFIDGKEVHEVDSMSFDKMDAQEFEEFWEAALDVFIAEISEDSINEILKYI